MARERISGWGNTQTIEAEVSSSPEGVYLARGNGMSYGDASLSQRVCRLPREFFQFDSETGVLTCDASFSLREILLETVPRGWVLPVVSGSSLVTIGGALASDIHGKNHHHDGSFSHYVNSFVLYTSINGSRVVDRQSDPDLFRATAGGMGLTGVIQRVTLQLKRLESSEFVETTTKTSSIEELCFRVHSSTAPFLTAWIHPLDVNKAIILEQTPIHSSREGISFRSLDIPTVSFWNQFSKRFLNDLYYILKPAESKKSLTEVLFPLETLPPYNRSCGEGGLIQFQCIVSTNVMPHLLQKVSDAKIRPILLSLKKFGKHNGNILSFAKSGLGVAIDYENTQESISLVKSLNQFVAEAGGTVYLTKDSTLTAEEFRRMYPEWESFQEIRAKHGALGTFHSLQSKRLRLD